MHAEALLDLTDQLFVFRSRDDQLEETILLRDGKNEVLRQVGEGELLVEIGIDLSDLRIDIRNVELRAQSSQVVLLPDESPLDQDLAICRSRRRFLLGVVFRATLGREVVLLLEDVDDAHLGTPQSTRATEILLREELEFDENVTQRSGDLEPRHDSLRPFQFPGLETREAHDRIHFRIGCFGCRVYFRSRCFRCRVHWRCRCFGHRVRWRCRCFGHRVRWRSRCFGHRVHRRDR